MNTKLGKTFGGFILGFALLLGIGFMASTTAQAQYPNQDWYQRQRELERQRQLEIYRQQQGRNNNDWYQRQRELERQRQLEIYRQQQRRNNNDWWNGNRRRSNDNYGTYDNYGNYGGSFNFRQTALNAGYNEGMRAGRNDRERGDRYNFSDEGAYQSASKDYNSRMGDRYAYQRYFREAFATGYRDGYQGY
jgi:hypothetical protein